MRKIIVLCGLGLILAAFTPAARPVATGDERSTGSGQEFYADEVVDQDLVVDAGNALGEPDGRYAEIKPGGELIVRMPEPIRYSDAADDGRVITKGGARYGLAGLFRMSEEGEPAWQPLAPGGTPGGFKLGTSMFPVAQSTETIRIVNDDTRSVLVDAVSGFRSGGAAR
jgi:hypothetical protein